MELHIKLLSISVILFASLCSSLSVEVREVHGAQLDGSDLDVDLRALIQQPLAHRTEVFSQALRIIDDLTTAPSCNRLATKTLIDSCRSLEVADGGDPNILLDHVKSTFAARLAVCELSGAHAAVPQPCLAMIPAQGVSSKPLLKCHFPGIRCKGTNNATPSYGDITEEQTRRCLMVLESRPQWWTSYSNARQNAVAVCHAARSEIDRDDMLNVYREVTGVTSYVSQTLFDAAGQTQEYLDQVRAFHEAEHRLWDSVLKEMEAGQSRVQSTFSGIFNQMDVAFSHMKMILESTTQAVVDMGGLNLRIKQSAEELDAVRNGIQSTLKTVVEGSAQLAESNRKQWASSHEVALTVQDALVELTERELNEVKAFMIGINNEMRASRQVMELMRQDQNFYLDRAVALDQVMLGLEQRAMAISNVQERQAQMRDQHHEQLRQKMQTNEDYVDRVSTKVTDLHSRVEEAATKIGMLKLLSSFTEVMQWLLCLLIGLVLSWIHKKSAAVYATAMALFVLTSQLDIMHFSEVCIASWRQLDAHGKVRSSWLFVILAGVLLTVLFVWSSVFRFAHGKARIQMTVGHHSARSVV